MKYQIVVGTDCGSWVKELRALVHDKDQKLDMVVNAEENAILIEGSAAEGGTIYVYGKPICSRYAGVIIQSGIKRVVAQPPQEGTNSKWDKNGLIAREMLEEACIQLSWQAAKTEDSQDKLPVLHEVGAQWRTTSTA